MRTSWCAAAQPGFPIICAEEPYFLELIRYIHLNPLRATMVKSLALLDRYKWSGHGALLDHHRNEWQDIDYVLRCFGKTEKTARKAYRKFVSECISQGESAGIGWRWPGAIAWRLVRGCCRKTTKPYQIAAISISPIPFSIFIAQIGQEREMTTGIILFGWAIDA